MLMAAAVYVMRSNRNTWTSFSFLVVTNLAAIVSNAIVFFVLTSGGTIIQVSGNSTTTITYTITGMSGAASGALGFSLVIGLFALTAIIHNRGKSETSRKAIIAVVVLELIAFLFIAIAIFGNTSDQAPDLVTEAHGIALAVGALSAFPLGWLMRSST